MTATPSRQPPQTDPLLSPQTDYLLPLHRPHHCYCATNTTMVVPFADVVRKTLREKTSLFNQSIAAAV